MSWIGLFVTALLLTLEIGDPGSIGREFFLFDIPIMLAWSIATWPAAIGRVPDWWDRLLDDRLGAEFLSFNDGLLRNSRRTQRSQSTWGSWLIRSVVVGVLLGLLIVK